MRECKTECKLLTVGSEDVNIKQICKDVIC